MAVQKQGMQPKGMMVRVVDGHELYWHVVTVTGAQKQIYIAGQVSRDDQGNVIGKGDMRKQIEQVGENLKRCLEAAGATLNDIVRTTTYTTQIDEFYKHMDVRQRYLGPAKPTSSTIGVSRLSHPDFLVEIDAIAVL